jgi:haloalkane dehalogenase
MDALRTPDERFDGLVDWPYAPHHADVEADGSGPLRMAYVDEGPADGPVVVLLHGEPSWSYLYRSMIGPLAAAGMRVVAPDLIGFGRSDKPTAREDYTYARHVGWTRHLLFDTLHLERILLFGQDWGGLIGLRLVGLEPDRFAAVVASNTFLPTGDRPLGKAFEAWRSYSQTVDVFPVAGILQGATRRELSPAELAAYDAPFPDESHKAGARQFPALVPDHPDDPGGIVNRAAWEGLRTFTGPFVCAFGDSDPITGGADRVLIGRIAGAEGQPHETLQDTAHFSQEDAGARLVEIVAETRRRADG